MGGCALSYLRRPWLAWAAVGAWMLVIFALSSIPDVPDQSGLPHARTRFYDDLVRDVAHVVEYGALTGLVWWAVGPGVVRRTGVVAAGWSLAYAASDEAHQLFVAGRTCSLADWLLDAAGAGTALLLLLVAYGARRRRPAGARGSRPERAAQ